MKSRTPLAMIELAVMLLVFALAAAFCLQAFAKADAISRRTEARDAALLQAQNAVELLKHDKGDLESLASALGVEAADALGVEAASALGVEAEAGMLTADCGGGMSLRVTLIESSLPQLGEALVEVVDENGEIVISLPAAWQTDF